LLLHKPTSRWISRFAADTTACIALDEKYLWLGNRLSYGNGAKCLQRIEKRQLYSIPDKHWTSDNVSEAETRAIYEGLNDRERALWHFDGGEYAIAASFLSKIEPPTPETLFLLGLCHDSDGLNDLEKSRAFFQRVIDEHSGDPLASEADRQLRPQTTPGRFDPRSFAPSRPFPGRPPR
jgi:hypothetical protein